MKLATSIIETLAYMAKLLAIAFIFKCLGTEEYIFIVIAAILWALGYALTRWERHLESKRSTFVKHYDYYVLWAIGWIILIGTSISRSHEDSDISQCGDLVSGIFLLLSGDNRRSKYKKQEESNKKKLENEETLGK